MRCIETIICGADENESTVINRNMRCIETMIAIVPVIENRRLIET